MSIDKSAEQLLNEERVAVRSLDDDLPETAWQGPLQQSVKHAGRIIGRQPLELNGRSMQALAPAGSSLK